MKILFEELSEKRTLILTRYGNQEKPSNKKLYAVQKWNKIASKEMQKVQDEYKLEYEDQKKDIEIDTALEIEITKEGKNVKQLVLNDKGEYTYSKEGERERFKRLTALSKDIDNAIKNTEIDFEPYLIDNEVLEEESEFFIEELKDIFIK